MEKRENLTQNLKVRVSPNEKEFIQKAAKSDGISISDLIRRSILDRKNPSGYAIKIQQNRVKHEIRNRIISMNISKNTKSKILKELDEID